MRLAEVAKTRWLVFVDLRNPNTGRYIIIPVYVTAKNPGLARVKAKKLIKAGKVQSKDITLFTLQGYTELSIMKVAPSKY